MTEEQRLAKNASIKEAMKATHEKRKSQVCRVYMLKVQKNSLSARQREDFRMLFLEAKWLYNDILNYGNVKGQSVFDYELDDDVEVKLPDGTFEPRVLSHIGSQMKQSVYADLKSSIKALARLKKTGHKVGRLKFKSEIGAVSLKQYGTTYKFNNDHRVKIQNIHGLVRVNGLDQIKDDVEFANAKLLNRADGYYLAVTTYTERKPYTDRPRADVGIDMGCHTSFTLSTGEEIDVKVKEPERLKRLQRKQHRQKKGSNSRRRTIHRIQKTHQRLVNRKNDRANKIVADLNSRFGLIYIQDENLSGWQQTGHGKAVQHSCLGRVKARLKAQDNVYVVNRWIPTTQQCINCGDKHPMPPEIRTFECECGLCMPRDLHSANRMVQEGRKLVPPERREFMRADWWTSILPYLGQGKSCRDDARSSHPLGCG
jgi:putative transposase